MDVDLCAGGDSTSRKVEQGGVAEGTMDVVPLEMYDSARAKIAANLRWLFAKAYRIDHIPEDIRDPFYTDQYDQEHIKPPVIRLLLSCELYCRVCSLILKTEQAASLQSHMSVIQALARKGIYVVESDDTPVTEEDLGSMPIKMSAHMPMIDALMMAYTVEMISIEKVVASVMRFSTFSASKEFPFDLEDAMVFWINKVNLKMREIIERDQKVKHHLLESPSHQKTCIFEAILFVDDQESRNTQHTREEDGTGLWNMMEGACDGAALLTVVHYYCSDIMKLEDICLKVVPSIADSLYNIQLLREFANEYLNKSFYLTTEDMLYSPLVLKHNVMVFIAELFWWFETVKPEFVQPRDFQEFKDVQATSHPESSRSSVPIFNATKSSFLANSAMGDNQSSPEVCKRPLSTLSPLMLHLPKEEDVTSSDCASLAHSISKDNLASNVLNSTPKHQTSIHQSMHATVRNGHSLLSNVNLEDEDETLVVAARTEVSSTRGVEGTQAAAVGGFKAPSDPKQAADGFYLEPLMPAVLKMAKEKSVCLNKEEECGEGPQPAARGSLHRGDGSTAAVHRKAPCTLNQTFSAAEEEDLSEEPPQTQAEFRPAVTSSVDLSSREGEVFYLHSDSAETKPVQGLDTELEDLDEEDEDLDEALNTKDANWSRKAFKDQDEEEESAKLQEDMNVKEHEDKDINGSSGHSSPCLSTHSQASSMASGSVRMTSFVELSKHFSSNHDSHSCVSSSQRTTPDGSEYSGPTGSSDRFRQEWSPSPSGTCNRIEDKSRGMNVLAAEIIQLQMQLKEKRCAMMHQKRKMEMLSARRWQELGKVAFLHIVRKGGRKSDMLPKPLKSDISKDKLNGEEEQPRKDDISMDMHKGEKDVEGTALPGALDADKKGNSFHLDEELDLNECNRSIELLNEAIGSIQQQMMQLSLQQEMLMKQNVKSPSGAASPTTVTADKNSDSKAGASFHFVENASGASTVPSKKLSKLTAGRSARSKPSELKVAREQSRQAARTLTPTQSGSETLPHQRQMGGGRSPGAEHSDRLGPDHTRSANFQLYDETTVAPSEQLLDKCSSSMPRASELKASDSSGKDSMSSEESQRSKAHLIEVDLSELRAPEDEEGAKKTVTEDKDGEQKSVMGFFFRIGPSQDEQKAEDELAKKRAAFLLKQQKKAEETRLRKQQLEAESELKRDKARQKAEQEQLRKEKEKNRRELIKQEFIQLKQQERIRDHGLVKPKTSKPNHEFKHDVIFRDESHSNIFFKCSSTCPKLFKEPINKSNKTIIHNAICHCCLAGKVSEPQKNQILEELRKCKSNHLMILFRDGGCQFRALYSFFSDTEEILKLMGTGPKSISKKMIDKLYKYSSDRKQFTVIPAKTVSVSVDALTIHNHLWQAKRGAVPKKSGK